MGRKRRNNMKTIEVVAAVIQEGYTILATRRGYGEFINKWEFPGGKIEGAESKEAALKREIQEELHVAIDVNRFLVTVEYDYPQFHLIMHCYLCYIKEGKPSFTEHNGWAWVTKDTVHDLDWLPADVPVVEKVIESVLLAD